MIKGKSAVTQPSGSHYSIEEHGHRFAAWAAAIAAKASPKCRFSVENGKKILEACGFDESFTSPDKLPKPSLFDKKHAEWRDKAIKVAAIIGVKGFKDGVAAKLINCYLKVRFVCGGYHEDERVKNMHPPIDSLLLKGLIQNKEGRFKQQWREFHKKGWSNFESNDYQEVIDLMRKFMGDEPLWKIEEYWPGNR